MNRVRPSDIVEYIHKALPNVLDLKERIDTNSSPGFLQTLSALLGELDEVLLPAKSEDYVAFLATRAVIQSTVRQAESSSHAWIGKVAGLEGGNAIKTVYELLQQCPDEAVPPETGGLEFISDPAYRGKLRLELASVEELMNARQWKAAMVMAGSLMEALLCDQVLERVTDPSKREQILRWHLPEYIRSAHEHGLITDRTKKQANLAREVRNLIHPGKELRENAQCSRATALGVLAAL